MRAIKLLLVFLCVLPATWGVSVAQTDIEIPPVAISATPSDGGILCEEEQFETTVDLTFEPVDVPTLDRLDLLILMDTTTSMGDVVDSVKANTAQIITDLQTIVPDLRVASATYGDYDRGNPPFDVIADFSTDATQVSNQIQSILLQGGGFSSREAGLRALYESNQLDWREGVIRIIVLFTDAGDLRNDEFPDGRRLTRNDIYPDLADNNIQVIGVRARGDSAAEDFLQSVAVATNGAYFSLTDASEIPAAMVALVSGIIQQARFSVEANPSNFNITNADANWYQATPNNFEYLTDGGDRSVDITIRPDSINQADGVYQLDLEVVRDDEVFGSTSVNFEWYSLCSDFYIPDTPSDDGANCTSSQTIFWESPAIIVRNQPDGGDVSLQSVTSEENYVYVDVSLRGAREATADVTLYSSDATLITTFPEGWQTVGTQSVTIAPNDSARVGPFIWTPQHDHISLRAVVSNVQDPMSNERDIPCENNLAVLHQKQIVLDNPSLGGDGRLGSVVTVDYLADDAEAQLQLDTTSLDGFVAVQGLTEPVTNETVQFTVSDSSIDLMIASFPDDNSIVPTTLVDSDTVSGMTIYNTIDARSLPPPIVDEEEQVSAVISSEAMLLGGIMVLLAVLISIFAFVNRNTVPSITSSDNEISD